MKNAFSVFVFGEYDVFLPYYIYSIEMSYPNTDIVVFYNDIISSPVKDYIETKPFVRLYENFYKEYLFFKNYKMRGGGGLTLLRYLIPSKYFVKYKKVYFGDVDVFILKEKESLFEFHKNQANKNKLPFSNRVRLLSEGGISKRLTGLHFVLTKPYFKAMDPIIERVLNDNKFCNRIISSVIRDEEFLYEINNIAFNFNPNKLIENKTPLHGFHLGVFRGNKMIHPNEIKDNSLLSYNEIKEQFSILLKDKEFNFILNNFYCREIIRTFKYFELNTPFNLKLKFTAIEMYNLSLMKKVEKKLKHYYARK